METIVNKVEQSGIVQVDLSELMLDFVEINLVDFLEEGLFIEKRFRAKCRAVEAEQVYAQAVYLYCSEDVIMPSWAWMLMVQTLDQLGARCVAIQDHNTAEQTKMYASISQLDADAYRAKKVMIKGCGPWAADHKAFGLITQKLLPVVQSLMFGEPCSAVPLYKKKG